MSSHVRDTTSFGVVDSVTLIVSPGRHGVPSRWTVQ